MPTSAPYRASAHTVPNEVPCVSTTHTDEFPGPNVHGTCVQGTLEDRKQLMRAVHLLYIMHSSNEQRHPRLPYAEFYNKDISRKASLSQEYMIWRNMLVRSLASFRFLSFPHCSPA